MEYRQIREKGKTYKKKWCLQEQLEVGVWLLFMLRHQIEVLRSLVLLHYSPSARLADRILMIHELRGSNQTRTRRPSHPLLIYCEFAYREFLFLPCHFNSALIPTYTRTLGHFFPSLLWRFVIHQKKDRVVFGSTPEFGGTFWEVECLTAFLHPQANAPRLAKSLHLYHLGNFSPKKKDLFWFCCCLFAFTFHGRSFSLLNMLRTRNGYKHLLLGFCTTGGGLENERL